VHIQTHHLGHGSNLVLEFPTARQGEAGLLKIVGGGRGCVFRSEGPAAGVWLPLRGRVQVNVGDTESILVPGELRVTEAGARIQAIGRGNALWVALLADAASWRQILRTQQAVPTPDPMLFPHRHAADRALRLKGVALARATANGALEAAANALIDSLVELQMPLAEIIARCPGRTYVQRRQVFLRLQRVRNYIAANCHLELDNAVLARMANYSPWHFIRAFRAAYRETPHAFVTDQRLLRARELLRRSPLAIAEIALASGFENRCAFSRLFRQRFGVPAGALRRQLEIRTRRRTHVDRAIPATSVSA